MAKSEAAQCEIPQTQVSAQLERMASELSGLDEVIGALESKLKPVLRNVPPANDCDEKDIEELVDVAADIRQQHGRLNRMKNRIIFMLDTLEV